MRRRRFLATMGVLGASAIAGCFTSTGKRRTLRMRETRSGAISGVVTTSVGDLSSPQRRLVRTAIDGGNATVYGYDPLRSVAEYVVADGTYYRVAAEEGTRPRLERPVLVAEPTTNTTGAVSLREYDGHAAELIAKRMQGESVVLHNGTVGREELLPEPRYDRVSWKNETYDVSVEDRMVNLREYTVTASAVADNPDEFEEYVRAERDIPTLEPGSLSDAERDIVSQAITDEYTEEVTRGNFSDAFEHVLDVVRSGERIGSGWPSVYFVVYDGTLYEAEIDGFDWG